MSAPATPPSDGVVTKASPRGVDATVQRILRVLNQRDVTVFSVVDHSGEAASVGLDMPDTKLVIFGSPAAGTPIMLAAPLSALDLPMKLLVWEDRDGAAWVSYNTPAYLAQRHHFADDLQARLVVIDAISDAAVSTAEL